LPMCRTPLGCIPDKIRMNCNVQRSTFNFQRPTEKTFARLAHPAFSKFTMTSCW
jgi:hypothetical protein